MTKLNADGSTGLTRFFKKRVRNIDWCDFHQSIPMSTKKVFAAAEISTWVTNIIRYLIPEFSKPHQLFGILEVLTQNNFFEGHVLGVIQKVGNG